MPRFIIVVQHRLGLLVKILRWFLLLKRKFITLTIFYFPECSEGYYGYDCAHRCETCNNTICGRYEGNCIDGCVEGFKGHQCLDPG